MARATLVHPLGPQGKADVKIGLPDPEYVGCPGAPPGSGARVTQGYRREALPGAGPHPLALSTALERMHASSHHLRHRSAWE